jgi:flagellar motor switch protein FliM
VLEVSPQLVLAMVEQLMGGVAEGEKNPRLITRIEQSIVRGIIHRALAEIQRAWKTVAELTFKLERYESEGDFVQIAPASEIVMVVSFEVVFGSAKQLMSLCFPTFALEGVLAKLNLQRFGGLAPAKGQAQTSWAGPISRHLGSTAVETTAILGETSISLRELLSLEPGDVLRTEIPSTADVQLVLGNKARFLGRPGIANGKVAIKVTRETNDDFRGE